jgi:hypothetical protein
MPEGFSIRTEKIISNGKTEAVRGIADKIEEAYIRAKINYLLVNPWNPIRCMQHPLLRLVLGPP